MKSFQVQIPARVDRLTVRRRVLAPAPVLPEGEGEEGAEAAPAPEVVASEETLYDGSYDAGLREGRRRALQEMAAARAADQKEMQASLRQFDLVLQKLLEVAEKNLPELLLAALGRVFREHSFTHEEMAAEVSALVREVGQAQAISIEASQEEIGILERRLDKLGLALHHGRVQWRANPTLGKGEYVLQTDLGMVDGRRLSKLAQIRLALEEEAA
ncbi:MAG: hypothetical protein PW734_09870 [Verrucomicrobium sp.]|nr:hypothetical protein [Verrucomicrobium sp.]